MNPSWKAASLILVGIVLGCGAGAVRHAVADPGPANPAAPRWQHVCDWYALDQNSSGVLSKRGQEGWELVSGSAVGTDFALFCYKRPSP